MLLKEMERCKGEPFKPFNIPLFVCLFSYMVPKVKLKG